MSYPSVPHAGKTISYTLVGRAKFSNRPGRKIIYVVNVYYRKTLWVITIFHHSIVKGWLKNLCNLFRLTGFHHDICIMQCIRTAAGKVRISSHFGSLERQSGLSNRILVPGKHIFSFLLVFSQQQQQQQRKKVIVGNSTWFLIENCLIGNATVIGSHLRCDVCWTFCIHIHLKVIESMWNASYKICCSQL